MSTDDLASPSKPSVEETERPRRSRVLKGAHAAFNQEHSAVPCIVRDLSETGAKLEFDLGWIVPSQFTLFVDIDGFKVDCEKVWHRGNFFGVRFIGPRLPTRIARQQRVDFAEMSGSPAEDGREAPAPTPLGRRQQQRPVFGKFK